MRARRTEALSAVRLRADTPRHRLDGRLDRDLLLRAQANRSREQLFGSRRPVGREVLFGLGADPGVVPRHRRRSASCCRWSCRRCSNVPHNPLQDLVRHAADAVIFAFVVMVAGGVREEIQRGFVLRRFEQYPRRRRGGARRVQRGLRPGTPGTGTRRRARDRDLGAFWGAIFLTRPLDRRPDGRSRGLQSRAGRKVHGARVVGRRRNSGGREAGESGQQRWNPSAVARAKVDKITRSRDG